MTIHIMTTRLYTRLMYALTNAQVNVSRIAFFFNFLLIMTTLHQILSIVLLAAILASCSMSGNGLQTTTNTFEHQKEIAQLGTVSSPTHRFAFSPVLPDGMSKQTWNEIFDKFSRSPKTLRYSEIINKIRQVKNWQEADILGRQLIVDMEKEEISFFTQQQIASGMLRSFFIHLEAVPETQRAMGFYMDMLVQNKYFSEPTLFAQILPKLQGYWDTRKIADVAQKTVPHGAKIYASWKGQPFTLDNYFLAQAKSAKSSDNADNLTALQIQATTLKSKFQQNIRVEASKLKAVYEKEEWFTNLPANCEDTVILAFLAEQNSDTQK
jgi:hypothetical protein